MIHIRRSSNCCRYFGQSGTDFDFTARNPQEAQKLLGELEVQQNQLSKKINKKVMSMFEKYAISSMTCSERYRAEQECKDLLQKKTIIENDKAKIEHVIEELEEKKNEALKKTWIKVNKYE